MPIAIINRKKSDYFYVVQYTPLLKRLIILNVTNRLTLDGNLNNLYAHGRSKPSCVWVVLRLHQCAYLYKYDVISVFNDVNGFYFM
jgi:hypothetical protein